MPSDFIPRDYQEVMIEHIERHDRAALWADMGAGKTVSLYTALANKKRAGHDVFPALVLAPKRVANTTWVDEAAKWTHLGKLRVQRLTGSQSQRLKALQPGPHVYTMNYENIPWLVKLYGEKWPFKTIIADESTKLKSYRTRQGGARTRALAKVAFAKSKYFYNLTGTPSPNGLPDLWGQTWFLDKGERLGRSFTAFADRWFTVGYDGYSLWPRPGAQEEIQEALKDICLTIRAEDWFSVDKPVFVRVPVTLPPAARKLYKEMEKQLFVELGEYGVEAANAAVCTNKCLQIAAGAMYTEDCTTWSLVHDEKLRALESVAEEAAGCPLLVAYQYRTDAHRIEAAFPQAVRLDNDPRTITKWNKGEIPLLLAHPASCGHGLNLQHGSNRLCFFNHGWNLEEYLQVIERLGPLRQKQSGYNRPVFVYNIVAQGTVEEVVLDRLATKKSVQDALRAALARWREG